MFQIVYIVAGQFTLFVPTDLAFNQFLQKLGGIKEVKYMTFTLIFLFIFDTGCHKAEAKSSGVGEDCQKSSS